MECFQRNAACLTHQADASDSTLAILMTSQLRLRPLLVAKKTYNGYTVPSLLPLLIFSLRRTKSYRISLIVE